MALERRPRISCQIRCEIIRGKQRTPATVVSLSEGGLGVKTDLDIEEGDDARVRLLPSRGRAKVEVGGIVWNELLRYDAHGVITSRVLIFVVSDPPPGFSAMFDDLLHREQGSTRPVPRVRKPEAEPVTEPPARPQRKVQLRRTARPAARTSEQPLEIVREKPTDQALPRPKWPLPPPKQDDTLPLFRVRVKQADGPRSKWLEIRGQSLQDVEIWIRRYLEGEWEILQIGSIHKPR